MIRSNIDGPRESHTKSRQTEKDQYHMVTPRCGSQKTDTINSSERQEKLVVGQVLQEYSTREQGPG